MPKCPLCQEVQPPPGSDVLIGRVVAEKYRLIELVGVGGMGRVYRAEQVLLGRTVAVKVIHPHLLTDGFTVTRFNTEARAASRLNHPNSVSIFDFGRDEDGLLYLVMEFLTGRDLATLAFDKEPLALDKVLDIAGQVLGALSEAHALGVVHRDLKPENIVLARMHAGVEIVKVLDFGLATLLETQRRMTRPGIVCGTPEYMSPEQARGRNVDGRSDLYALGVTLFEMLAGRLPFQGASGTAIARAHVEQPPPDLASVTDRMIPRSLSALIGRALAKDPKDRFADAAAMRNAVAKVRDTLHKGPKEVTWQCVACRTENTQSLAACELCGAARPLAIEVSAAKPLSPPPQRSGQRARMQETHREGNVRHACLADLGQRMLGPAKESVWLCGAAGSGKTRGLQSLVHLIAAQACVLRLRASSEERYEPHALGIRLFAGLARLDANGRSKAPDRNEPRAGRIGSHGLRDELRKSLESLAERGVLSPPAHERVVAELERPQGERYPQRAPATRLLAAALTKIYADAVERVGKPIVIAVDDVDCADSTSYALLVAVARELPLMVTGRGEAPESWPGHEERFAELDDADCLALINDPGASTWLSWLPSELKQPAALLQIQALGVAKEGDMPFPSLSLADAVVTRFAQIGTQARELLQWLALFPSGLESWQLECVLEAPPSTEDMRALTRGNWLEERIGNRGPIRLAGRWLGEVLYDLIPKERRRLMHQRVVEHSRKLGLSGCEVFIHAVRAGDGSLALMLAERLWRRAHQCGDDRLCADLAREILRFCRETALATGDPLWDRAVARFSASLAVALASAGEATSALGIIRETLHWLPRSDRTRLPLELAMAQVYVEQRRPVEALEALASASKREQISESPHFELLHTLKSRALAQQDAVEEAARLLHRAWEEAGNADDADRREHRIRALFEVAAASERLQGPRAARALVKAALDLRRTSEPCVYALRLFGDWAFAHGELDAAEESWRQAEQKAEVLGELGMLHALQRRLRSARRVETSEIAAQAASRGRAVTRPSH